MLYNVLPNGSVVSSDQGKAEKDAKFIFFKRVYYLITVSSLIHSKILGGGGAVAHPAPPPPPGSYAYD